MNKINLLLINLFITIFFSSLYAQKVPLTEDNITSVNVFSATSLINDDEVLRVIKDSLIEEFDEATFAKIDNIDFSDGVIEVKALSRLLKNAPVYSRGFIGIAFHINDDNSKFESIYLRPTNARAEDQVRRNHSIQYFAYPGFKFQRLRKESPEKYESYVDMTLDSWIDIRIEIKDGKAKLFIDNSKQPSLIVNDLKLGKKASGGIGLFVDIGTEGFFKDLKVYKE